MSFRIVAAAWAVKGLSPAAKLVLVRLADMANDEGVCWPSYASIARDVEIDVRSVRRIVAGFEAAGIVLRQKRYKPGGLQTSNWLTVCPPDDRRAVDGLREQPGPVSPGRTGESSLARTGESALARTGESGESSREPSAEPLADKFVILTKEQMCRFLLEALPGETRAAWVKRVSGTTGARPTRRAGVAT